MTTPMAAPTRMRAGDRVTEPSRSPEETDAVPVAGAEHDPQDEASTEDQAGQASESGVNEPGSEPGPV